jgi:hypothetical protein
MDNNNPFSAAGPHYGHLIQETFMFKYLLGADNEDIVSLEYYDDIAIEKASGDVDAVQSKSALSWNPISNRDKDLWKTFSNWIAMSEEGLLDPQRTTYIIALARERSGPISTKLQQATDDKSFDDALGLIKEEFKEDVPETLQKYVYNVLNADRELLKTIVFNFDIDISESPREAVLEKLQKQEEEQTLDTIFRMMTGWIKDQIEIAIEKSKPPFITGKQFRDQLFASRRELAQELFLHSYAQEPSPEETDDHLTKTYVKQLELVECDTEEKIEAISSYIKARSDKIIWADDGSVHKHSFDEFYASLEKKWKNEKRKADINYRSESPEVKGRAILYECNDFKEQLAGLYVPSHFTPGCFHDCSNKQIIGWHQDYRNLLDGEDNE